MPLRRRLKSAAADGRGAKGDEKKGKRQRLVDFFRSRKQSKAEASGKQAVVAAAAAPVRPPLTSTHPAM
jgi:hypothetical protein